MNISDGIRETFGDDLDIRRKGKGGIENDSRVFVGQIHRRWCHRLKCLHKNIYIYKMRTMLDEHSSSNKVTWTGWRKHQQFMVSQS